MDSKDFFTFNANDQIFVKVREKGIEYYVQKHNESLPAKHHISCKEFKEKANKEGFHVFQFHQFMDVFGATGLRLDSYVKINFLFKKDAMEEPKLDQL